MGRAMGFPTSTLSDDLIHMSYQLITVGHGAVLFCHIHICEYYI